jgi:hypothetical protein
VNVRHGIGWEALHIAIDDHSRVAYAELLSDERGATAVGFSVVPSAGFGHTTSGCAGSSLTMARPTSRTAFGSRVAAAAPRALADAALYVADERQSRATYPNHSPGVGVPPAVLHLSRSGAPARRLDRPLQRRPHGSLATQRQEAKSQQLPATVYPSSGSSNCQDPRSELAHSTGRSKAVRAVR